MMHWYFRSLLNRILAIFLIAVSVILAGVLNGGLNAWSAIHSYDGLLEGEIARERDVLTLTADFKKQVQEWKNVLLRGKDDEQRKKYWGRFQAVEKSIQASGAALSERVSNAEAASLLKQFLEQHKALGQAYRKGYSTFESSGYDSDAGDAAVSGVDREPTRILEQVAKVISGEATQRSQDIISSAGRSLSFSGGLIGLTVVLASLFYVFFIRRNITQPTRVLAGDLKRLAAGDFTSELTVQRRDELGQVASSVAAIQQELGSLIREVSSTTNSVAAAAEELAVISDQTNKNIHTQRKETDQVAAAVSDMSASLQEVARNGEEAASAAREADSASTKGSQIVLRSATEMRSLAEEVEAATGVMQELSTDTTNIGNVLEVIRDIAEQTNLLALNAAIEAARAGEQGRGFAVVADEVRTLASRTQASTQEIQTQIEKLQSRSERAMNAMERSQKQAGSSVEEAEAAGRALQEITAAVTAISERVASIAESIRRQEAVAGEIDERIGRINQAAGESSNSMDQVTAASGELSKFASALQGMTARFTV